jgi:hypothetical protein
VDSAPGELNTEEKLSIAAGGTWAVERLFRESGLSALGFEARGITEDDLLKVIEWQRAQAQYAFELRS